MWLSKCTNYLLRWIVFGGVIGGLAGSASAIFLIGLDAVTNDRLNHPWLLFCLPLGGAVVSYMYMKYGGYSGKGNNLILESIQDENDAGAKVPLTMLPLVLGGSIVTHWFGGSAGREGTAVQMGGSLAEWIGRIVNVSGIERRILLMCGISAGFGSIFGTPLAGTIFAVEIAVIGYLSYQALLPCLIASVVGDVVVTHLWGVGHVQYSAGLIPQLSVLLLVKVIAAAVCFGLISRLFSELTHILKKGFSTMLANPVIKSAIGGCIVIVLVYITGSRDYLGLGIPLAVDSFQGEVSPFAFMWKLVFTSVTLGAGFQGGEVTPLFVIGATLGHTLADWLVISIPFLAALGFISVFSGASHTPIACFIMGIELFGLPIAPYMLLACLISYICSGSSGIYMSQRVGIMKRIMFNVPSGTTLAEWRANLSRK